MKCKFSSFLLASILMFGARQPNQHFKSDNGGGEALEPAGLALATIGAFGLIRRSRRP